VTPSRGWNVANTVAGMSRHPAVAVPRGWTAEAVDHSPIAVAIDGRHPSTSTLGYAFTGWRLFAAISALATSSS
jgi:hypothetical protein